MHVRPIAAAIALMLSSPAWSGETSSDTEAATQQDGAKQNTAKQKPAQNKAQSKRASTTPSPPRTQPPVQVAQTATAAAHPREDTATLPENQLSAVHVTDTQLFDEAPFDPTQSSTTVGPRELERRQPQNVFDAVRDVPGVSIDGGPRSSGMKFNIRGYDDTEDVRVKLDGVTKQFEKYRFGGTFIEPDLLKSIEVQRGPQIASGSGALGGTVSATTKDAADLLAPGQRFGAQAKAGYATNNYETLSSVSAYGRPTAGTDVLVNLLKRDAKDYKLPDGSTYPHSETNTDSALLKGSVFLREDLRLSASFVAFNDTGLQPYDATGGTNGVGGDVIRTVNDRTVSTTLNYEPGGRWINLRGTVGYGDTHLHDVLMPGLSTLTTPYPPGAGVMDDYYKFDIWTIDLANTSKIGKLASWLDLQVLAGLQYDHNQRDVSRVTQNPAFNSPTASPLSRYPNGFNAATPPGTKVSYAAYVQPRVDAGPLSLIPGIRWDAYKVEATGGTLALLQPYNQFAEVSYTKFSPSFGASLQLPAPGLMAFYNYAEGFRPPLIDEAFTYSIYGRCASIYLGPAAPKSQICGDLYKPEESRSQEVGLSYVKPGFWNARGRIDAKATYFWSYTDQLLESLWVVSPGVVGQAGWEKRHGVELEGGFDTGMVFARAAYSYIRGTTYTCANFCVYATKTGLGYYDLFEVPGDTTSLTVGVRLFGERLELSYNLLDAEGRNVIKPARTLGQPNSIAHQDGYLLHGASIGYAVNRYLDLRVVGTNLTNETYYYNNGRYQGDQAPGRSVYFTVSAKY